LLNSRIQIEQLRHDQVDGIFPVLKITLPKSEFGAFKSVSVSVLSFDNSFKIGFQTGYSLVLQKQIDSFKSDQGLSIYNGPATFTK
jgi:hypothetical protein